MEPLSKQVCQHRDQRKKGDLHPLQQPVIVTGDEMEKRQNDHVQRFIGVFLEIDSLAKQDGQSSHIMHPGVTLRVRLQVSECRLNRQAVSL